MELMPLVPLWCRAIQRMGTTKRSFVDFDQTVGASTGGFSISPFATDIRGRGLHSFTSQLNLSAFYGIGGARRGHVAHVKGV
jgi:Zn-dependent M16 (insulinase) family peptidase